MKTILQIAISLTTMFAVTLLVWFVAWDLIYDTNSDICWRATVFRLAHISRGFLADPVFWVFLLIDLAASYGIAGTVCGIIRPKGSIKLGIATVAIAETVFVFNFYHRITLSNEFMVAFLAKVILALIFCSLGAYISSSLRTRFVEAT